jgi:BirA family biotin operon repressor/biotin-[acetyl-CoA-carboxylase] ligase
MTAAARLDFGAPALQRELAAVWPGLQVEVAASVDSTNTRLNERLNAGDLAGDLAPRLLVAVEQTAGRGRMGRAWHARPGASLTFSLALPLHPPAWSGLSLAVGVALAEALDPAGTCIGLKWPNDLWRLDAPGRGRKLGGVLVETVGPAARRFAIVGVGLNLQPLDAPDVDTGVACVSEFAPALSDAPAALRRVAPALAVALQRFGAEGFAPFAAGFRARDLLFGQALTTSAGDSGLGDGIAGDGALRLRRGSEVLTIVSGEVSVRPRAEQQRP